ncbi:MAG: hypothetical protein FJZ56_01400 [Chlamydiae bacterium]|nr:hypothetical protein [Chlamydiota bacterium]
MKIRSFKIYAFSLPLFNEEVRNGFLIELKNDQGATSYGEVSPLPGRSIETRQEALFALFKLQEQFIQGQFSPFALPASVAFGMESALLSLKAPIEYPLVCNYTALSFGKWEETSAKQVKIKVSHLSFEDTVTVCNQYLKQGKRLILDFNKSWSKEAILKLRKEFGKEDFDGLEDPTNVLEDIEELYEATGFAFHVDELFSTTFIPKGVSAIVIKPSLTGNIAVIQAIKSKKIPIRLSSAFESEVGLMHIIRLSKLLDIQSPLGIDTSKIFKKHLIHSPFVYRDDEIHIDCDLYNKMPIDRSCLQSCQPSLT